MSPSHAEGDLPTPEPGAGSRAQEAPRPAQGAGAPAAPAAWPDFRALFEATPTPLLVVQPPAMRIVAVNEAYLAATLTRREDILGQSLFGVFPDDPDDGEADGVARLRASLQRVLDTRRTDTMALQRYPIRRPARWGGGFEERWWSPINTPVLGRDGGVELIIHRVEDVTAVMREQGAQPAAGGLPPQEQQALVERLRAASVQAARAQAALRESEARQAFLVRLADALRPLADPLAVQREASRLLRRHLDAARVVYAEAGAGDDIVVTAVDGAADMGAIGARLRLADYGAGLEAEFRTGQVTARSDVNADPTLTPAERAACAAFGSRAWANAPLVKDGRLVALLTVHFALPHAWSTAELAVLKEVAERTWAAVEQARAEAALRASQARLALIFERALVGLSEIDADGRFVRANAELGRIVGRPPEALLRLGVADVTCPEDLPSTLAAVSKVLAEGGSATLDKRYQRPDGTAVHAQSSITRLDEGEGREPRLLAVTLDLSARRRAEAALRESEQRFRAMVDLVPDLLWSSDPEGRVEWFNGRWTQYTGRSARDSLGHGWMAAIHPDDLERTRLVWRRALAQGQSLAHEHRIRRHDGQYCWHLVRIGPLRDARGRIVRWFGSATDVHEQRSARELLERQVQQRTVELRAVLNSAASAIVATDLQGRITTLNPAAEALLRLPAAQALGRPAAGFVEAREWRRRFHQLPLEVRQALQGEARPRRRGRPGARGREWCCVRGDGSRFPALLSLSVLRDEGGQPMGFLAVVTDLSERKRLEAALRQRTAQAEAASRAKSTFLAHMSHEFRTPLNAVIGLSHLLARMELPPRALEFVRHIEQGGEQLLALINDVLDLSRIEAGEMRLEQVAFELRPLLEAACALVRPQAGHKQLALALEAAGALPERLLGDPLRLKQILINLLGNAVKFTPAGSVTLRARALAQQGGRATLRLEVADTGIGIEPALQARIFEPFTQADSSITRRFGGTGLGLSIVRRLVAMMGGELALDSAPGRGTTFALTLTLELARPA